jgi:starch synthase
VQWSRGSEWIPSAHLYAYVRTVEWLRSRKPFRLRLVSVGRLTAQKVSLLRHELAGADCSSKPALHLLLEGMAAGVFILLGSGDNELESFMCDTMRRYPNFLYLQGFSEALATSLYSAGDLFLMPSSFEPCGISQMLAMRGGTPCIVHHVGGLKNTVTDGVNGFAFSGGSVDEQCRAMLQRTHEACEIASAGTGIWQQIHEAAANIRFSWDESTAKYIQHLYQTND